MDGPDQPAAIDDDFCNWAIVIDNLDRVMQCPPQAGYVTIINLSLESFTFDPFDTDQVDHVTVCLHFVMLSTHRTHL